MHKIIFLILFLVFSFTNLNYETKANDLIMDFDKIKAKMPFKKKPQKEKPKMVETRQQWEAEAQNVPLEQRKLEDKKPEIDTKKFNIPETKYTFEAYNYPQGTREINIENVKKNLFYQSYLVADNQFQYAAYQHYYYSPDTNQISSNFFVEKLDTSKTKVKRILDFKHKQQERKPKIEAGTKDYYPNLFRSLTLVDWSSDSKKLLVKEKIGSTQNGVYKTHLYIYFMEDEVKNGYLLKLEDFDEAIKHYYLDWENKQLIKYRYDIIPLGFSKENDDIIIAHVYVFDNNNNKIFLGTWGYDCANQQSLLISKENITSKISVNGIIVKEVLE